MKKAINKKERKIMKSKYFFCHKETFFSIFRGNILFGEEDIDLDSQENIVKEETSTNVDSEEKKEDDENIQLPNNEEIEGQNQVKLLKKNQKKDFFLI